MPEFLASQTRGIVTQVEEISQAPGPAPVVEYPYVASEGMAQCIGCDGVIYSTRWVTWAHGPKDHLPPVIE